MDYLPNIRHLSALLEIARRGSISQASEQIHLSQPALTQALNKVEAQVGCKIFERGSSGMHPSKAGAVFLRRIERAQLFLQAMDKAIGANVPNSVRAPRFHQLITSAQLRALTAVVEQNSISLAAAHLGLAQPTVQRAAKELEALAGQTLFVRSSNGVDPSALARRLARLANLAIAEIRQGIDEVGEHRGEMSGQLAIGSLPLARSHLVPTAVTRLLALYPEAKVSIVDGPYEQLLHNLLHSQVDLIIGALRQPQSLREIRQELLFNDPLNVVVRRDHPLLQSKRLTIKALASLDWIAPRQGTPARRRFTDLFDDHGLEPPRHVIECSSSVATRGLLLQSDRAALLSRRQMEVELKSNLLGLLPIPLSIVRPIGYSLRRNWQPTAIQARFLEILRELSSGYEAAHGDSK